MENRYDSHNQSYPPDNTFRYLNSKILIIGKKESGKTSLVRDIYQKIQNEINEVHVFSNVASSYSDITNAIYDDFHLISDFLAHCYYKQDTNKLVIIENLLDVNQIKMIEDLLYKGKNYNMTIIVTMQYPFIMMPEHRNQFNYLFTSYYDFIADQKRIHDYYFYMYQSFEYFQSILAKLADYQFLGVKVQSSPYVVPYKPKLHSNLRFIQTQKIRHLEPDKYKEIDRKLDEIANIIGDIISSLNKLTQIIEKLKE